MTFETSLKRCRVFVASSSDVKDERERLAVAVAELNRQLARALSVHVELVRWETHSAPAMGRAQEVINPLVDECDIFVGVMWKRFGIPTGRADGGTEEEFQRACEMWRQEGRPRILFYFSDQPAPPPKRAEDAEQLLKVARFREYLETQSLVWSYTKPTEFESQVRLHLGDLITEIYTLSGAPKLVHSLDLQMKAQVEICKQRGIDFKSPSLLLGMLDAENGLPMRCINATKQGEGQAIQQKLQEAIEKTPPEKYGIYKGISLEKEEIILQAHELAHGENRSTIDERLLFLAFLKSDCNTSKALKRRLGASKFAELVDLVDSGGPASSGTIDIGF